MPYHMASLEDDSLRRSLREHGYALVPNFLPRQVVEAAYKALVECLVSEKVAERAEFPSPPAFLTRTAATVDPRRVNISVLSDESLEEAFHSSALLAGMKRALAVDDIFVHPFKVLRWVPPVVSENHWPAGVHQDYPEFQGSVRQLTCWIPLTDLEEEAGVLPIYPGAPSQLFPLELADNPSGWSIPERFLPEAETGAIKAGDALVFSTLTPHGAAVNQSDCWRLSLECRYGRH